MVNEIGKVLGMAHIQYIRGSNTSTPIGWVVVVVVVVVVFCVLNAGINRTARKLLPMTLTSRRVQ